MNARRWNQLITCMKLIWGGGLKSFCMLCAKILPPPPLQNQLFYAECKAVLSEFTYFDEVLVSFPSERVLKRWTLNTHSLKGRIYCEAWKNSWTVSLREFSQDFHTSLAFGGEGQWSYRLSPQICVHREKPFDHSTPIRHCLHSTDTFWHPHTNFAPVISVQQDDPRFKKKMVI